MTQPAITTICALDEALKYAEMGLRVFPLQPGTKIPMTAHGVKDATDDPLVINDWWTKTLDAGIGLAARAEKVGDPCFLEFDQRPWLPAWARELDQTKPITRLHKSGGKESPHYIFRHTEKSLALGNCDGAKDGHEWFSFRAANRYIVAPPSVHPDSGKPYTVELDVEPVPIPDWLVDAIAAKGVSERNFAGDMPEVDVDFDFDAFCDWLPANLGDEDGSWYAFAECPVAGRRHKSQGARGCALYYDGGKLGFKCHAAECPSNADRRPGQSGVGYLVSFVSQEVGAYPSVIWPRKSDEEIAEDFCAADNEETATAPASAAERSEGRAVETAKTDPTETKPASATAEPEPKDDPKAPEPAEFPEDCMYGKLAEQAKEMHVQPGLAYPALLACWSVKPDIDEMCGTRVNLYAALCAPVGCGKNLAIKRALAITELHKGVEYKKAAPPGTRAFMEMIGDKPSGKRADNTRIPGPKKMLIATNEMTDVLKMTGIENSTLASRLCDIWDENEFEYPTSSRGPIVVNCRFSWVGGVPCSLDNATRFTELFDAESSHGLYDRLILGYADTKHNYKPWEPPHTSAVGDDYDFSSVAPPVTVEHIRPDAQQLYDSWNPEGGGSRVQQNCKKVAILSAMANEEREVGVECMAAAIRFMEWQIALRKVLQPGAAINDQARCRKVVLDAMERVGARKKYINVMRLAHDRKWGDRFGDWLVKTTITNLADMGELVPKVVEDGDGQKKKSKTTFMLRDFSK